ncbi:hypothetical protein HN011_005884 [Eciton burchellii]|nr:hypothetical protein HN011_005884 [Eciton burchellii]
MCFRHFRLDDLVQSGIGGFPVSLRLGGIMLCDFYLSTEAMEFAERGDSRNAWIPADHHRSLIRQQRGKIGNVRRFVRSFNPPNPTNGGTRQPVRLVPAGTRLGVYIGSREQVGKRRFLKSRLISRVSSATDRE